MAKDVKIFGHSLSPLEAGATIIGGLAAVYFVYKQHKASTAASTSSTSIDPVTGLPYSQDNVADPLTGETYLAEAQQYGSVSAAEAAFASASSLASTSAAGTTDGTGLLGGNLTSTQTVSGATFATNTAWAQAVTVGLGDIGYVQSDVASALGMYLAEMPLNTLADGVSAVTIVQTALAEYGPPPVGTFTIIQPPTTTPVTTAGTCPSGYTYSATSTGKPGEIDASGGNGYCELTPQTQPYPNPNPNPNPSPSGHTFPAPTGLKAANVSSSGYDISWNPVTGASSYTVATYNSSGTLVDEFEPDSTSTKEYGRGGKGLPKGSYHSNVWANGGSGSPPHATVYVTIP